MPSRTYTLSPLFRDGLVTDLDSGLLQPSQAATAQDCIWSLDGDLCKRGAFLYATGANPLNANTDKITSAVLWYDGTTAKLIMGDAAGRLAAISSYSYTPGGATTTTASAAYSTGLGGQVWPVVIYDNEIIITSPPTRTWPTMRWSGATGALTSGAGTVSAGGDDDRIQGVGTNFLTRFSEANRYIVITDDRGVDWYFKVAKVESDTLLRVTAPVKQALDTGLSWSSSPIGYFNLCAVIDDRGRVSNSTTTVTGDSTSWTETTSLPGVGDIIGQTTVGSRWGIASVTDDNTLTTSVAPSDWSGTKPYRILRRQPGHIVCEHQNRLYFSGTVTYPNRVHLFPAGASASVEFNGIDSSTTDPLSATMSEFFDVPSTADDGCVTAMVSVREPGGLAVFRDRDFYMVYGEWPSIQIQKLSSEIGCTHWRGACEIPGGVAWLGYDGVYIHRPGGGIENITEGKIGNEYRTFVRGGPVLSPQSNNQPWARDIAYIDDHIVVTLGDNSSSPSTSSKVYAYNMLTKAWATWTGVGPVAMSTIQLSRNSREVLLSDVNSNRFLGISPAVQTGGAVGSSSGVNGTFNVVSGGNIFGARGNLGRVIDMKLTHTVSGTSTPQLLVRFAGTTAATIGAGSNPTTTRIRPSSTQMGVGVRQQQLQFIESSGTFSVLRLKEATITQRLRRQRA